MSDIENLATWINNNQDKKGSDQWNTVAAGLQELSQTLEQTPAVPETDTMEDYLQASADYENANRNALERGFRRSVDLTGEGVGSAIEGVGSVLGLEGLEEYGADMALENEAQLQRAETFATRRQDVEGLGTGASYFGETLAESSVPMGIGIGTGALAGALVGGGVPGALIGAGAAALSQLPLFYGWNRQRQKEAVEQGLKPEISEGAAFLTAIPQAVAEGIVDRLLVGGFFAKPAMKQGGILTRIGKGSVRGAAAEVPTEIGQQVLERAQAGLSLDNDEAISEYIDAGVAAGMLGGTIGGVGNVRAAKPEPDEISDPTEITETTPAVQGELFDDDTDLGTTPITVTTEDQSELFGDDTDLGTTPITVTTEDQSEFDFGDARAELMSDIDKELNSKGTISTATADRFVKETKMPIAEASKYLSNYIDNYRKNIDGATQTEFDFKDRPSEELQAPITNVADLEKSAVGAPDTALSSALLSAVGDAKQEKQLSEADRALTRQKTLEKIQTDEIEREDAKKTEELALSPEIERTEVQDSLPGLGPNYGEKQRQARIDAREPTTDPSTITTGLLAKLGIRAAAPIRKRIINKSLSDPVVRQELIKHANTANVAQQTKLNISNYLRDVPEAQGDLFPPRRRKKPDANIRKTDAGRSGDGVQADIPKTDDKDAKEFDASKKDGVGDSDTFVRSVNDRKSDADSALDEVIFEGETETSLAELTRNQQVNIAVVEKNYKSGEITKVEADRRVADIKTGKDVAKAKDRAAKNKVIEAEAEKKQAAVKLAKTAKDKQTGLDASARKSVDRKTSIASIKNTIKYFEENAKPEIKRWLSLASDISLGTDVVKKATADGKLNAQDVKKLDDFITKKIPKRINDKVNALSQVQEQLQKSPFPVEQLEAAAYELVLGTSSVRKGADTDAQKHFQGTGTESALRIEKWVNENLSKGAQEWFTGLKVSYSSSDPNTGTKIRAAKETLAEANREQFKKLPLDAVSNLDTPMHPTIVQLLLAGNLKSALEGLAITSQSTRVSALANVLADNIGTTKLKTVKGLDSAGIFDPKTNTISLNTTEGLNTHTLLHEMLHAVVSANLENKSNPTTAQLNTLFKSVKDLIPTAYGAKNLDEFVSEAMSNPEFQATLASINVQGEPVSVYRRFMNIIANFARKLVGVSPVSLTYIPNINESLKGLDVFSMIDTLVQGNSMFDALIAPAPEYRNADMLKLNATAEGVNSVAKAFDTIQKKINSTPSAQNFADQFIGILVDLKENARRIILKLLGTQALADVAEKAGFGNLPRTLHEAIEGQRGAMMGSDARLDIIMTKLAKFSKDSPKLKEVMDKLIYSSEYGSTINQVDPLLSKADAEAQYLRYKLEYLNNKGDLKTKSFKTKKDRDAEYSKFADPKYEAEKLNPESEKMDIWELQQKELNKLPTADKAKLLAQYTELRDTYRNMYEKLKDVVFGRIDAALAGDPEASKKLKSSVYKKIFKANTLAVYFPLTREGRYKLTYSYKNVNQAPESEASPSYVVRMFSTRNERDRAASEIRKDDKFEKVKTDDGDFNVKHFENAPSFSFVGKTLDALKANKIDPNVQREIVQLFINTLPETSFAKSFQKRKGFEGFIEDSLAAFRIKSYDLGRQTERLVHGKIIQDIEKQIYDLGTPDPAAMKAKSFVGKGSEALTASFISVRDELLLRGSFARNPPSEPLIKLTNQFAFIYTIGFNVSSAIVNLSQVPLFVMPYLGARYGYKETMSDITTAGKLVTAAKNNVLSFYDINEQGDYTVKSDVPKNLKAEFELIKPVVQMAAERGLLTTSFLKDALGLDESGRTSSKFDTVSSVSAFFFNHAERFNRQTTIFAGYKLELARLMGKNKNATTEQKTAAAKEAIRQAQETNGGAVLETAPRLTQRSLGRVAFMYKSYGLQMYYTMFKSFKAATDTDMSAKERSIARKQLAGVFGTSLFFAGVHGVPIYGAVSVLYNLLIAGEDDDDFDTVVRKTIGEGWYKGVPAMTGIDPSNRIRLTGLLLQENKFDRNSDLEGLIGFHLGGPALSSAKRIQRGAKDLYQGELMRGVESLLPAGVANMYKAFPLIGRISVEGGYKSRRGDIIYDDVNVLESAGQFLGFAPTGYMLEQERNNIVKGIDTAISRKRSKLLKQYYVAKRFGDFYGMREIRKDMREFSRKHREAAITSETIDRSMKQHAKTSLEMYNGIRLNPLMRETLEDSRNDWDQGLQLFD